MIEPLSRPSRHVLKRTGRHLIYCEGTKTEPNYIFNIKRIIHQNVGVYGNDLEVYVVLKKGGLGTGALLRYAENDLAQRLAAHQNIDHVWLFYDKDDFDDFDIVNQTIEKKNTEKINEDGDYSDVNSIVWHSCWSNQSFELWVLLHFGFYQTPLSRKNYIPLINHHLKVAGAKTIYRKNFHQLYDLLKTYGDISKAVERAKQLDNSKHVKKNPSTGVYHFIEYFKLYLNI